MKKSLFFAAFALFALVACEQQQSELNLDGADVKTATITGQVTYNPGGTNAKTIPADSVEVRALVANAEYSGGATGDKQFGPVRTDKNGMFTLTIPVGQQTITTARIQVVPFLAEYTDPNTGEQLTVYYTSNQVAVAALSAGDVERKDIVMKPQLEALSDYTSSVKISGIVTVDAGYQKVDGGYDNALIPYANKTLKVKGTYGTSEIDFEDVTTDDKGAYSFDVPAGSTNASVVISTVRFDGTYTEGPDKEYQEVAVFFNPANTTVYFAATDEEKLNVNFTVNTHVNADGEDLSKEFVIQKIEAVVKTYGEVLDENSNQPEVVNQYKWDEVFNIPFQVTVTLSSPDFDLENPTSALVGKELVFETTPSTVDGKVVLENIKVFSAWSQKNPTTNKYYDIQIKVSVADLMQPLKHTYFTYVGFSTARFKTQSWADWHKDSDPSEALKASFWSGCWPNSPETQEIEGYYQNTSSTILMGGTDLHYYHEFSFPSDIVVNFNVREPESILGIWDNPNYNTRNDKDKDGNFTPLKADENAMDKDEIKLTALTSDTDILTHAKYQGACRSYWKTQFGPYLW